MLWLNTTSGGFLVLLCCLLGGAQTALAHAQFLSSDPDNDSVLDESPASLTLEFNQAVTPVSVSLLAADTGETVSLPEAKPDGRRVIVPVPQELEPGQYLLGFRVLSGDAHSIDGAIRFSIGAAVFEPPPTFEQERTESPARVDQTGVPAESIVRPILLAALLLVVGSIVFRAAVEVPPTHLEIVDRIAWVSALAVLPLALLAFFATSWRINGTPAAAFSELGVVLHSSIGQSLLLTVAGCVVVLSSRISRDLLLPIGAGLLVLARIVTGHPASAEPAGLLQVSMALHVTGAGFWFASLLLLPVCIRRSSDAEAVRLIKSFSRVATIAVGLLVVAGVAMAVTHLRAFDALINSDYGQILLWKLLLVLVLLLLAACNRWLLSPGSGEQGNVAWLKRSIRLETFIMLAVLVFSATLATTPPATANAESRRVVSVESEPPGYFLTVNENQSIDYGESALVLNLTGADGSAIEPIEVRASASLPAQDIEGLPLQVSTTEEGGFVVSSVPLGAIVEVRVLVSDFDSVRFRIEVPEDARVDPNSP